MHGVFLCQTLLKLSGEVDECKPLLRMSFKSRDEASKCECLYVASDVCLARVLGAVRRARSGGRGAEGRQGRRGSAVQPGLPVSE